VSVSESFELVGVTSSLELSSYLFPTIGERMSPQKSLASDASHCLGSSYTLSF